MRRIRMMIGLTAAACTLLVLSAPAMALKEPAVFGKFKANLSGPVKGIGEAGEMVLGPYKFEECEKELHAKGMATAGESETLPLEVKFNKCVTSRSLGGGLKEKVLVSFTLNMEFHSNNSVKLGPATVTLKASKSACVVTIPAQWIPAGAETKGDFHEFEAVSYKTEKEKQTGKSGMKKFGEFRERLGIEWELKSINANAKVTPDCEYEGGKENKETHEVEYGSGRMEGELEELTLKGGNLSFVPKP
jgi:hypothetical protein